MKKTLQLGLGGGADHMTGYTQKQHKLRRGKSGELPSP